MTCAVINPRTDLLRSAKRLREALKNKPCVCQRAWTKDGYVVVAACEGCLAMDDFDSVVEALHDPSAA